MDKKKISSGLKLAGFWLAVLALFMYFGAVFKATEGGSFDGYSFFDYMFKTGIVKEMIERANFSINYNAIYIVAFVLALIAIISLGTVVVTKLIGKEKAQLTKGAIIVAIVCLVYIIAVGFAARGVLQGELYKNPDIIPPEYVADEMKYIKLGSGAICSSIFGILGVGSLVGSLVLDKK